MPETTENKVSEIAEPISHDEARKLLLSIGGTDNTYLRLCQYVEQQRAIAESQAPQPSAYMCPTGCGCLWRDNRDGTMSLFGHNSKSCGFCEVMALGSLIPLYERVTATKEQPEGAEWKPDSMQANAAPFLENVGTCRTPHFLGEPTPDRKALTQIPHYELPNGLCKDWREMPKGNENV